MKGIEDIIRMIAKGNKKIVIACDLEIGINQMNREDLALILNNILVLECKTRNLVNLHRWKKNVDELFFTI